MIAARHSHRSPLFAHCVYTMAVWGGCALLLFPARADSLSSFSLPRIPNPFAAMPSVTNMSRESAFGLRYTHLEGNGQIWQVLTDGASQSAASAVLASFVVDPLASQLDFGIPWGYRANKKVMSEIDTINAICDARPSHCLLTMGLDDHTHLPTLRKLMDRMPEIRFVVAPSCREKLIGGLGIDPDRITVLDHGGSCDVVSGSGGSASDVTITATRGALVGPPWQERENGYLMEVLPSRIGAKDDDVNDRGSAKDWEEGGDGPRARRRRLGVYYEPHGDVVLGDIESMTADVVISPVIEQSLPAQVPPPGRFTLVYGGERTLEIAETLRATVILPLGNGELDIDGPLSGLVAASGNVEEFEMLVDRRNQGCASIEDRRMEVARAMPGVPITVMI